jgi:hypothetical protein
VTEVPPEAVQDAALAISRLLFSGQPAHGTWMEHDEDIAWVAIEAAAPALEARARAAERAYLLDEGKVMVSREALDRLVKVAVYVSRGRGFVDVEPYPDATARAALGALPDDLLYGKEAQR